MDPVTAQKLVAHHFHGRPGFDGVGTYEFLGRQVVCIKWREKTPIPPLPAEIGGVPVIVMPSEPIRAFAAGGLFRDAWDEYVLTLKELWRGES
jgi:hypothetical protein